MAAYCGELSFGKYLQWNAGSTKVLLKGSGTCSIGARNAANVAVRHNIVRLTRLPAVFDGFSILHLSDLHCDVR
jgi:hypothetical protein